MDKKKILKIVGIIILVLVVIFLIHVIKNFIIITNLVNISEEFANKTNYVAVVPSLQNGNVNIAKSINKDGNSLTILKNYGKDNIQEERGLIKYEKDNETVAIIYNGQEKVAMINQPVLATINIVTMFSTFNDFLPRLQFAVMSRISTDNAGNYLIELDNWKMWVDKDTGLVIREINGGLVTERSYEFDNVKDEDIVKPDISDCKIQEN